MISIVIPNHNSNVIHQVIAGLHQQTAYAHLDEIIIVGQDGPRLIESSDKVRFIASEQPLALAAARNIGARHSRSKYLAFLDADCIPTPKFIERLLEGFHLGYEVVGGSVMSQFADYWSRCDHLVIYHRFLQSSPSGLRTYLPGGNLSISRCLFLQMGGFDERFWQTAGEDVDLCRRLGQRGHTLFFQSQAVVWHHHPRASFAAVTAHLRRFGHVQALLWHIHGAPPLIAASSQRPRWNTWLRLLAPLLALWDTLRLYGGRLRWRDAWYLLPGIIWVRMAWYVGLADGLLAAAYQRQIQ